MQRRERLALLLLCLIVFGLPAAVLGYQFALRPLLSPVRVIDITAAVPEAGGFQPGAINVQAGETVLLRFSAVDVTHGVAIGPSLGIDLGPVDPGHVKEVTLTFDRAGTYTFYCNTWCSPNHWRMRGVLEVRDPNNPSSTPVRDPVIEALATQGVNIDANLAMGDMTMPTPIPVIDASPSAVRGALLISRLMIPADVKDPAWQRSHTPAQALDLLSAANPTAVKADLAAAAAYLWLADAQATQLDSAAALYAKNCAACHGSSGGADGPAAKLTAKVPTAFSDPALMFTRRSDVLYAKIRRGGMGTDMPNWGTIFTPDETWALVDYLWSLAFGRLKGP